MSKPTCAITGATNIITASVSESHDSSTATAAFECVTHSFDIGDSVTINMGYDDINTKVFKGYVKIIEHKVPSNTYSLTCSDDMVKAIDNFIVSTNPEEPYTRHNIAAETAVGELMALSQLTDYTYDATLFVFAVSSGVDMVVNQTSAYDYCRFIADTLTWHLWADRDGQVHFENRKPYVMTGSTGQPGDLTNETYPTYSPSYVLTDISILDAQYTTDEKDLRNRVVVYGASGIFSEASAVSPYLPAGFYKTVLFESSALIDQQTYADLAAAYNLALFNRLTETITVRVPGDPTLTARTVIGFSSTALGLARANWYLHTVEHSFSKEGFTSSLTLKGLTI